MGKSNRKTPGADVQASQGTADEGQNDAFDGAGPDDLTPPSGEVTAMTQKESENPAAATVSPPLVVLPSLAAMFDAVARENAELRRDGAALGAIVENQAATIRGLTNDSLISGREQPSRLYDTVHASSKAALRRRDLKAHMVLHPVEMSLASLRNCIREAEKNATSDELALLRELQRVV